MSSAAMPINIKEYQKEYQKQYGLANKDELKSYRRAWYAKNKDKVREYRRKYNLSNKQKLQEYKWKLRYGITPEEVRAKYVAQEECCAICKRKLNGVFDIDHDHQTEQVRGLLCKPCNQAIGLFNENISTIVNSIDYLNRWNIIH